MAEKLLLHTCCAPCLLSALFHLKSEYEITVFYFNPNIYPPQEYEKRKSFAEKYCMKNSITFVEGRFNQEEWLTYVSNVSSFESMKEGDSRCSACFRFRLKKTAEFAKENRFSVFTTTLTSGANKNAQAINKIGDEAAKESGLKFLSEDFKRGGGADFSRSECRRLGIYRQNYCGCRYSLR
jgi:predicted adenine nucleotide alpha hydrolase (AANH) superfamily ATPase